MSFVTYDSALYVSSGGSRVRLGQERSRWGSIKAILQMWQMCIEVYYTENFNQRTVISK